MATTRAGELSIDTCFPLSQGLRRRLLQGNWRPLRFEYDPQAERDGLPDGLEPGATYVLAWSHRSRSAVDGIVIEIPREPKCWFEVTKIGRHKSGDWLVRFDVTDRREPDLFLAPGNGYTTSRMVAVDDLAVVCDKHVREVYDRDKALRLERAIARRQQWRRNRRAGQREMRRQSAPALVAA